MGKWQDNTNNNSWTGQQEWHEFFSIEESHPQCFVEHKSGIKSGEIKYVFVDEEHFVEITWDSRHISWVLIDGSFHAVLVQLELLCFPYSSRTDVILL